MTKLVLPNVASGYSLQVINDNFQKIQNELQDKVMYRDNPGGEPNTLETDFDANGQRIINLPEPLTENEAARLKDVQNAIFNSNTANLVTVTPVTDLAATNVQAALVEIVPQIKSTNKRTSGIVNVEEYRQAGYTDQQTFDAAATAALAGSFPIYVPPRSTQYSLTADLAANVAWVIHPLANIATRNFPSAVGTGGGYLGFNKNRLTGGSLYGQEQIDSNSYGYGKNFLMNPYFKNWQRLDLSGASFVTADAPTYGDANTYSGSGGLRVWGPDGWYGKVWGGAYNAANPGVNAGAGSLKLERKGYGTGGDFLDGSPYYLRSTFTGWNGTAGQYTDPVYGLLDYGTNSVIMAGQVLRNARRTGKMTARIKSRLVSGDPVINLRLTYCFGTGGSPNVVVNLQGFTLNPDTNAHDYLVHFEVPSFTVDANGTPITFGTAGTDYITFEIAGGSTGNCTHDYFGFELRSGWGVSAWENCPASLDLVRCRSEYQIAKVAYAGSTVSGSSHGGCAVFNPPMHKAPTVSLGKIDYNSGAFTGGIESATITGAGFGYTNGTYALGISGGGGTGATGTYTVSGNVVTSIAITAAGTGFTTPPVLSFPSGGGYGASASASLIPTLFGIDKNGCQWWLKSGFTGNNSRVIAQLECNAQLVTR